MPSIAGFIQSLLTEDMYATGLIEKMDERIAGLNNGQLKLLVHYCETKISGLTNKTVLDAYRKLLGLAKTEAEKRHEEEVRGERENLIRLKAAHAGVNAKAWDTAHTELDRELEKFQKFLKSKARRSAEEEVQQRAMEDLHIKLMALPARRVAAENRRRMWWGIGGFLAFVVSPIILLSILPVGVWPAIGATAFTLMLAGSLAFIGAVTGLVISPRLNNDALEKETRKCAMQKLKGYRREVRRNYEEFELAFAADMNWRDKWVVARKQEHKKKRRKANEKQHRDRRGDSARIAPGGDQAGDVTDIDLGNTTAVTKTMENEEEGRGSAMVIGLSFTTTVNDAFKEDGNGTAKKVGVASGVLQPTSVPNRRSGEADVLVNSAPVRKDFLSPDLSPNVLAPADDAQVPRRFEPEHDDDGDPEFHAPNTSSCSEDPGKESFRVSPEDMPRATVEPVTRSRSFRGDLEAGEGGDLRSHADCD